MPNTYAEAVALIDGSVPIAVAPKGAVDWPPSRRSPRVVSHGGLDIRIANSRVPRMAQSTFRLGIQEAEATAAQEWLADGRTA